MKKILCVLLVSMLLFCSAYAENEGTITFLDIPWLSDEVTVMQALREKGYLQEGANSSYLENCYYLIADNEGNIEQMENGQYKDYCRSFSLKGAVRGKIAGYPVEDLIMSFAYDGRFQFIYTEIKLIGGTYEDIKQKLEKVYDKGEEFETVLGYLITAWKTADNSCVLLYTYDDGMTFNLYYGRTDAAEILANCSINDPDDVSGL